MKTIKVTLALSLIVLLATACMGCSALNAAGQIKALDGVLDISVIQNENIVTCEVILEPGASVGEPETLAKAAMNIAQKRFRGKIIFLKLTQNETVIGSYMN